MNALRRTTARRDPGPAAATAEERRSVDAMTPRARDATQRAGDALAGSPRHVAQRRRFAAAFGASALAPDSDVARAMGDGPLAASSGGSRAVQRMFQHKGSKKKAEQFDAKSPALPKIHGVSAKDLRALADDTHDYGAIENKTDFEQALGRFQQNQQQAQAQETPLQELQAGNVTVLELDAIDQGVFAGTVRVTLQLDWLQGKHDQPFMSANSSEKPRKLQDTQMRLSLEEYRALAREVPLTLLKARLADLFGRGQRQPFDFSVMGKQQSDRLYYEISAMWADTGANERHVLVYYHCFPDKTDQKQFGFGK